MLHASSTPSSARASSKIETSEGTFRVSQPTLSSSRKSVKATITFTPSVSHFDTKNAQSGRNEFRGFFTLFWISCFILTLQTYATSLEKNGFPLSLAFATLFSKDAKTLAISDGVLVASTGLSVVFAKAVSKGWIRYYNTGLIIQHTFQALMLAVAIIWTFNRQWPWVQSGFLTLHSLVMIMKVHSYCSVNGYLQDVSVKAKRTENELRAVAAKVSGSYDAAMEQAVAKRSTELKRSDSDRSSIASVGVATPDVAATASALLQVPLASELRNRLEQSMQAQAPDANGFARIPAETSEPPPQDNVHPHPLAYHPDQHVAALARQLTEYERELTGTEKTRIRWPANITFRNFADYQVIPTLVYELEFPRTDKIRPLYVLEKTIATFGTFALLYTVTEHSIIPLTPPSDRPFWRALLDLSLPFMLSYLLLFYLIFECVCNGFAELSRWNATSMDEFSRKWNIPVHRFLLRHVYTSTMTTYKLSRHSATFLTFLLSAAVHELVMAIVTKKIRMYLFFMQMVQIPMIFISRIPIIRRNKILGNITFWLGLYTGFPLLCVAYCAY